MLTGSLSKDDKAWLMKMIADWPISDAARLLKMLGLSLTVEKRSL